MVAAEAAVQDDAFIEESRRVNAEGLQWIGTELAKRGIEIIPSYANFLTFKISSAKTNAKAVFESLLKQGVIVRPIAGYGLPDYLRVSIGTAAQNKRFMEALDHALA
jgi:histidinol-phosphate aminotransferase